MLCQQKMPAKTTLGLGRVESYTLILPPDHSTGQYCTGVLIPKLCCLLARVYRECSRGLDSLPFVLVGDVEKKPSQTRSSESS